MDKNKLISLFEKQVMSIPKGINTSIFDNWFEKIYLNSNFNPNLFKEVFTYGHKSLELREPKSPPQLTIFRILPEHSKMIDDYFDLKEKQSLTTEEQVFLNQLTLKLLFEILRLEIENFSAKTLRNEYINSVEKTFSLYLKTLEKANSFKNYQPKNILLNNLDNTKMIYLNYFGPVIHECLISEIEHYKIEVKKINRKLSSKKIKIKVGLDITLSKEQLKQLFIEFRDNLKCIDEETNENDFIASFSNEPIQETTFKKISWKEDLKLAIFIGENVENKFKWNKCEYLFTNNKDLRKKYDSAKRYQPINETLKEFENALRKIKD